VQSECPGARYWFIVTRGEEEANSNGALPGYRVIILCHETGSTRANRSGQSPNCCKQFDTSSPS
jgi:hypothetical protein